MSTTIVDMPKVTQMLDSGWVVRIWRNDWGTYSASAGHRDHARVAKAVRSLVDQMRRVGGWDEVDDDVLADMHLDDGEIITDDHTPEQALTLLAYKVHGEFLGAGEAWKEDK